MPDSITTPKPPAGRGDADRDARGRGPRDLVPPGVGAPVPPRAHGSVPPRAEAPDAHHVEAPERPRRGTPDRPRAGAPDRPRSDGLVPSRAEAPDAPHAHGPDRCPHGRRRSQPPGDPYRKDAPAFERRRDGSVVLRSVALARAVLRAGEDVRQAGFNAESMLDAPDRLRRPILFQEGREHREQRARVAPFFTPVAAEERYRSGIEELADELVAELQARGSADLSVLTFRLAVRVAAQVVGLTDSLDPRMDRRLEAFFSLPSRPFSWRPSALLAYLRARTRMLRFYLRDVRPAIDARRRAPQDDVISQLLAQERNGADILIEAVTFGAAGMATTREFIAMAAWHLLDDPHLRAVYQAGDETERRQLLAEILRLEPVVGHLFRRVLEPLELEVDGRIERLEPGTRVDLDLRAANVDEAVVGDAPMCPVAGRELRARGVQPYVLSFGDGHHRCPGSYLALEEADAFLQRLFRLPGLRLERAPTLAFSELVQGYELRGMWVACTPGP